MSLPSVTKEKTSNKVSLVTGSQQPTLIYVQSIQPQQSSQSTFITTKPKIVNQSVRIATTKSIQRHTPINKIVAVPSTSSAPNRVQTFQLKTPNVVSITKPKPVIVGQTKVTPRFLTNHKQAIRKITTVSTPSPFPVSITTNKSINARATLDQIASTTVNHRSTPTNASKLDPVKYRYRTILENLLQLKNNFVRRTITQAIKQKLCNQSNEDLLNVIFKSFELTLLSVNVEQIYLNVSSI